MNEPKPIEDMLEALEGDHARLRKLGSTILQAIEVDDVDSAAHCLLQLQVAQTSHFKFEERLMKEAGYPGHEAHARSHARLTETLGAINQTLGFGRFRTLSRDLGAFIQNSLAHVAELDETFREFLNALLPPSSR